MDQIPTRPKTRLDAFKDLRHHAWYSRFFKRLTALEQGECIHFVTFNESLDPFEFHDAATVWNLDRPKPFKNQAIMTELVLVSGANSIGVPV